MSTSRSAPSNRDRGSNRARRILADQHESLERKIGNRVVRYPNGCWVFDNDPDRYGHITVRRTSSHPIVVHRFVYETLRGPIPEGHELHHTCGAIGCCNPDHLTPMSHADHMAEHARIRRTLTGV